MRKLGVGYSSDPTLVNHKTEPVAYAKWRDMLTRVYNKDRPCWPQYGGRGVTVCNAWLDFVNFVAWFKVQRNAGVRGFELDKDLLDATAKVYSPETCSIVPREINQAVLTAVRGKELKTGVSLTANPKKPYRARYHKTGKVCNIGVYETETLAHEAYNVAKAGYVRSLADKYADELSDKLYLAVMSWEPKYEH